MEKDQHFAIKYNASYRVVEANELIRSKQDELTPLEAKLIRLMISQILEFETDFKTYSCLASDIADFLGMNRQNVYREMDELTDDLMLKRIYIQTKDPDKKGEPEYKKIHWVEEISYKKGRFTIRLSEGLKPYLLSLNSYFTSYEYGIVPKLPNNKTIRLYELLVALLNCTIVPTPVRDQENLELEQNEFAFDIDYIKEFLNCTEKYPNTGDFIKRVISPAIDAIKKASMLRVSFRKITKGKKITHLVFRLNDERDFDIEQFDSFVEEELRFPASQTPKLHIPPTKANKQPAPSNRQLDEDEQAAIARYFEEPPESNSATVISEDN